LGAVVEYAEQIARRSERIHFSVLDLKDEAAQPSNETIKVGSAMIIGVPSGPAPSI